MAVQDVVQVLGIHLQCVSSLHCFPASSGSRYQRWSSPHCLTPPCLGRPSKTSLWLFHFSGPKRTELMACFFETMLSSWENVLVPEVNLAILSGWISMDSTGLQAKDLYWHHLMFLQEISLDQTALSLNSNSCLWITQPSRFGCERWQTILFFFLPINPIWCSLPA